MLNKNQLHELHQIMKRSELITMLANAEITHQHIFTDAELHRATIETFINEEITRKEINFKKICLLDEILSELKKERGQLLDQLQKEQEQEKKEELKKSILQHVRECDNRYDTLCCWHNFK